MTAPEDHTPAPVDALDRQVPIAVHEAETMRAKLMLIHNATSNNVDWEQCQSILRGLSTFLRLRIARVSPPTYDLDALREGMTEGAEEEAA